MSADLLKILFPQEKDRRFIPIIIYAAAFLALFMVFAFFPIFLLRAYQGAPMEFWGLKVGTVEKIDEEKKKTIDAVIAAEKANNELKLKKLEIEKINLQKESDIQLARKQSEVETVKRFYEQNSLKNYWFWRQTRFSTTANCNSFFTDRLKQIGFQTLDYSGTIHAYRDASLPNYTQSIINCFNVSGLVVAFGHFHSYNLDVSTRIGETFVNEVDRNLETLGLSAERKVFGRFDSLYYQKNWLNINNLHRFEDCVGRIRDVFKKIDATNVRHYERYSHGITSNNLLTIVCQNITVNLYTFDITTFGFDQDETKSLRDKVAAMLN